LSLHRWRGSGIERLRRLIDGLADVRRLRLRRERCASDVKTRRTQLTEKRVVAKIRSTDDTTDR
jgi:hypothetical protein